MSFTHIHTLADGCGGTWGLFSSGGVTLILKAHHVRRIKELKDIMMDDVIITHQLFISSVYTTACFGNNDSVL